MTAANLQVAEWGTIRPALTAAIRSEIAAHDVEPSREDRLLVLVGAADAARPMSADDAEKISSTLTGIFERVQAFVRNGESLRNGLGLVFVVDDAASMGDPVRPLDSTIAGALLSFVRALALECRRANGHVSIVMTATIDRDNVPADDIVARRIVATLDEGVETTGREDFIGAALQLGRINP